MEQVGYEPESPAANGRGGTGVSAEPVHEARQWDNVINDHNLWTREAPTAHTAANQAQKLGTDRVNESRVVNIFQSLKTFILKEMDLSISKIREKVRTDRADLRKLREDVSQATSNITTAAFSIFIKQRAITPRVKETQRKMCLLTAIFSDNEMWKSLPQFVIRFLTTRFLRGSNFTAVSFKDIQYYSELDFLLQLNKRKTWSSHLKSVRYTQSFNSISWFNHLGQYSVIH